MRNKEDFFVGTRTIEEKRRFLRITVVKDETRNGFPLPAGNHTKELEEAETVKLLETVAPLIDQVSGTLYSELGHPACIEVLLTSLFKRVYLREIGLLYCGQIAYDFLEDQINNSPFLSFVCILGRKWPRSSLDLLKKFCLKGRPGINVHASVSCKDVVIDTSDIQELFDHWKASGNLNFQLSSIVSMTNDEGLQALLDKGEFKKIRPGSSQSFFKHETEKSLARVSNSNFLIECFTCGCDRSEKCHMKEKFPEYHYLLNHTSAPKSPACQEATSPMGSQILPTSRSLKGSPKRSQKDEEVGENKLTFKLKNIKTAVEAIKKSTLTSKALDEQIYKLKLLYEDMEKSKEETSSCTE
uniref:THAP-type domain-containing protein n=1 Tax=Steinernema glaseri TaxID=37863 RepID=A0A1I7YTN9_9BILA